MKKITEYLQQLGLSKIEANLYLMLLKSGPLTVKELAETVKINRTATYTHITSLYEKGVIAEEMTGSRKRWVATEPDKLHYLIENKLDSIKQLDQRFPHVVMSINSLLITKHLDSESKVTYYKGKNNAIAIYKEALQTNELRTFVKLFESEGFFDNVKTFNEAFTQHPKLKIKEIIYNSPLVIKEAELIAHNRNYAYKLMPSDVKLDGNDILIYDENVVIITYGTAIESIVLHSSSYANNYKALFDFMWNMLPEPKTHL